MKTKKELQKEGIDIINSQQLKLGIMFVIVMKETNSLEMKHKIKMTDNKTGVNYEVFTVVKKLVS